MHSKTKSLSAAALMLFVLALAGCSVHVSKNGDGSDKDVDVRSPFGSVSVHQGETDAKDLGLPVYPGSHLTKDSGDDDSSANVNVSSAMFGVKVIVRKFQSDDAPDKVLAFYQDPLSKFGKVIQCSGGPGVNVRHRDKDRDDPVSCDDNDHEYDKQLKVGTEHNQHVVAVKPSGKGSQFALVYVHVWNHKDSV